MKRPSSASQLPRREKIGQTCQIHGRELGRMGGEERAAYFQKKPVGSIFLGSEIIGSAGGTAAELQELIAACQEESRIPLSISGDLENGAGGAIRGLTEFPNLLALGAVDDPVVA